jgi:hypothetical protein
MIKKFTIPNNSDKLVRFAGIYAARAEAKTVVAKAKALDR